MLAKFPDMGTGVLRIQLEKGKHIIGEYSQGLGLITIGKDGINYETAVHEMAHALDWGRSIKGRVYSKEIVHQTLRNLIIRSNSKEFDRLSYSTIGYSEQKNLYKELLAYSVETEHINKKFGNKLSKEIYRITVGE